MGWCVSPTRFRSCSSVRTVKMVNSSITMSTRTLVRWAKLFAFRGALNALGDASIKLC